jgi:hypothetical protein
LVSVFSRAKILDHHPLRIPEFMATAHRLTISSDVILKNSGQIRQAECPAA